MAALKRLVDRLAAERGLPDADMLALLACGDGDVLSHLFARARAAREARGFPNAKPPCGLSLKQISEPTRPEPV